MDVTVKVTDSSSVEIPEFMDEILEKTGTSVISFGPSSWIDGFAMYSDGKVVDLHPNEFDDD